MDIKEDSFSDLLLKESFFLLIKPENKIYLNTSIKNLFFEDLEVGHNNNIEIDVGLAKTKPIGVDTDEDYLEIKKIMEYIN